MTISEQLDNELPVEGAKSNQVDETVSDLQSEVVASTAAIEHGKKEMEKLQARRESGEISPFNLDLNYVQQFNDAEIPLVRKDLDFDALVLDCESLHILGSITFIHIEHGLMRVTADDLKPSDVFVLYPEDLI